MRPPARPFIKTSAGFLTKCWLDKLAGTDKVKEVTCPTCRKVKDRYSEGILTLGGDFLKSTGTRWSTC